MYLRQDDGRQEQEALGPRHAPCLHLLSKGMFVTGQLEPIRQEHGMGDGYCWCNLTQRSTGPDAEFVARNDCRPGRDCYQARL